MIPIHLRALPTSANMTPFDHVHFLQVLAFWIKPEVYVEYGVASGNSIEKVALLSKVVHGVDISPYKPIAQNITFHQCSTRDAIFIQDLDIDMAFIDADHASKSAFQDFEDLFARLVLNGFICIHDTYPVIPVMTDKTLCEDSYRVPEMIKEKYGKIAEVLTLPFCPGLTIIRKSHMLEFMKMD